jgi:hypothetical protein
MVMVTVGNGVVVRLVVVVRKVSSHICSEGKRSCPSVVLCKKVFSSRLQRFRRKFLDYCCFTCLE